MPLINICLKDKGFNLKGKELDFVEFEQEK
jgi:hypothetical protein